MGTKPEIKLFLPKELTSNQNHSDYSIAVYCSLKALASTSILEFGTSPEQIGFLLTKTLDHSRRFNDYLKDGLDDLIAAQIISKIGESKKSYYLDCSKLWTDSDDLPFTIITLNEAQKIFEVENVNNFKLLRFFIFVIGTISNQIDVWINSSDHKIRTVGNLTIDYISKASGISSRTAIEYFKILEDIELLYVYRQKDFIIDEIGNIKKLSNVYGRKKDKIYIDTFANNQKVNKEAYRYTNKNVESVNYNRRLAQMYNHLLNGKDTGYSEKQILEIYNYVLSENKKYTTLYEKNGYESYLNKIRDVDIFDKYNFTTEK